MQRTIYTKHYFEQIVKYFFENGIDKKGVKEKATLLYRGIDSSFDIEEEYVEKGFMATSTDIDIANNFAGDSGNILRFRVSHLPSGVPFVWIDNTIADHLHEKEVLFLPGKITTHGLNSSGEIKASYEMNPIIKDMYMSIVASEGKQSGGTGRSEKIPIKPHQIDLRGKYVIWYRAIKDRKVEILKKMRIPKVHVQKFFTEIVLPLDDTFERKTDFIPEFQDLKQKDDERTDDEDELYASYIVHMAIYDPIEKCVDTLHYGVFDEMFGEVFGDGRRDEEIKKAIIDKCSWL